MSKTKAEVMKMLLRNKGMASTLKDAISSPLGSTSRVRAQKILSIMDKLHGLRDGAGGPGEAQPGTVQPMMTPPAQDTSPIQSIPTPGLVIFKKLPPMVTGFNKVVDSFRPSIGAADGSGGPGSTLSTPYTKSQLGSGLSSNRYAPVPVKDASSSLVFNDNLQNLGPSQDPYAFSTNWAAPNWNTGNAGISVGGANAATPSGQKIVSGNGISSTYKPLTLPSGLTPMSELLNPVKPASTFFGGALPASSPAGTTTPAPAATNDDWKKNVTDLGGGKYSYKNPDGSVYTGTWNDKGEGGTLTPAPVASFGTNFATDGSSSGSSSSSSYTPEGIPSYSNFGGGNAGAISAVTNQVGPLTYSQSVITDPNNPFTKGQTLAERNAAISKGIYAKYKVDTLSKEMDTLTGNLNTLPFDIQDYIAKNDNYMNYSQGLIDRQNEKILSMDMSDPIVAQREGANLTFLQNIRDTQADKYIGIMNRAVRQNQNELTNVTNRYNTVMTAANNDITRDTGVTTSMYNDYKAALEDLYTNIQDAPARAMQLQTLNSQMLSAAASAVGTTGGSVANESFNKDLPKIKSYTWDSNGFIKPNVLNDLQGWLLEESKVDPDVSTGNLVYAYQLGVNSLLDAPLWSTTNDSKTGDGEQITPALKKRVAETALAQYAKLVESSLANPAEGREANVPFLMKYVPEVAALSYKLGGFTVDSLGTDKLTRLQAVINGLIKGTGAHWYTLGLGNRPASKTEFIQSVEKAMGDTSQDALAGDIFDRLSESASQPGSSIEGAIKALNTDSNGNTGINAFKNNIATMYGDKARTGLFDNFQAMENALQEYSLSLKTPNGLAAQGFNEVGSDTNAGAIGGVTPKKLAIAIGKFESSGGNYKAVGPVTESGDKAYGAYQVMGANIPSWTKNVLGRAMTIQEFLNDPVAQDKVAESVLGGYLKKYGNPQDAASAWFSGGPLADNRNDKDVLGTTVPGYIAAIMKNLG